PIQDKECNLGARYQFSFMKSLEDQANAGAVHAQHFSHKPLSGMDFPGAATVLAGKQPLRHPLFSSMEVVTSHSLGKQGKIRLKVSAYQQMKYRFPLKRCKEYLARQLQRLSWNFSNN